MDIQLRPLAEDDREQFILDNQYAFRYGALEEFGRRDDHFEEEGEIISRETILRCIQEGIAYRIVADGEVAGGLVLHLEGNSGHLDLLFTAPDLHSRGIGYGAWRWVEEMYPQVTVWETCTPCFEKRNIHFYVNRCGFHIVEYFHPSHPDPNGPDGEQDMDEMFRFEKRIGRTDQK